ncbi:MAG: hypothetical protein WKF59_04975 [Chitinophagaceae bacterium]
MTRFIITLLDTPIQFPDEFLKRWLQRGGEKEKSAEEVEARIPILYQSIKVDAYK